MLKLGNKQIIGCYYPNYTNEELFSKESYNNYFSTIEHLINKHPSIDIILMGDFNILSALSFNNKIIYKIHLSYLNLHNLNTIKNKIIQFGTVYNQIQIIFLLTKKTFCCIIK